MAPKWPHREDSEGHNYTGRSECEPRARFSCAVVLACVLVYVGDWCRFASIGVSLAWPADMARTLRGWMRRPCEEGGAAELCASGHRVTAHEVFTGCPDLLSQVASFAAEEADDDSDLALYRRMRCWSRGFSRFVAEEAAVSDPGFSRTVVSCRAIVRSSRKRSWRLLLVATWLLLIGVLCPVLSTVWAVQDATLKKTERPDLLARRECLFCIAVAALLLSLGLPASAEAGPGLQSAVELLALRAASSTSAEGIPEWRRRMQSSQQEEGLEAARSSIPESAAFLMSVKRGLIGCSALGLVITLHPLTGACLACAGVLVGLLPHAKFAGYDVKLSVRRMLLPSRNMDFLGVDGGAFLAEQMREDDAARLRQLPDGIRLMAVRALTSSCLMVCTFRSLAVWVGTLHGCGQAERDAHDVACLPSLVAMLCPGFVAVGAVLRFRMACPGCCESHSPEDIADPGVSCYAAAWVYLTLPLVVLNSIGLFVVLRLLADVAHSPLREVFFLWRVPAWEEVLVLLAICSLWLALLLFGAVVPACLRCSSRFASSIRAELRSFRR
mmetsp:Transcript_121236/g.387362  ORF Transcript_121236/g.387362 Transcript_121236/m.387362 type:complete len:555 (-) Transcript_121236:230-1894(-)